MRAYVRASAWRAVLSNEAIPALRDVPRLVCGSWSAEVLQSHSARSRFLPGREHVDVVGVAVEQDQSGGVGRYSEEHLLLTDLVLAECVYVLESFYEFERPRVAEMMRSAIAFPSIATVDTPLLRALEIHEIDRLDFAEAYLVAQAEATGVGEVLSFDRSIDMLTTVTRREP